MSRILSGLFVCLLPFLVMAQGTVKITSGLNLTVTGNALITLESMHLDNDGTLALSAGNGTIRFSGNATTNISGVNQPQFDILQLAKTGGTQLQLNRNITIVSSLNFVSGLLNLNSNNINLQATAALTGESETSCIIASNGGYVEITQNLDAPASSNPGNLGAILSSNQNLGSTVIRRGHQLQSGAGLGSSIYRYFDIIPSNNSGLNATLRFNYFETELNGLNENSLLLMKSQDNINWTIQGFTSRDATANYVEKSGNPDFSRWTLSVSGPLPVHLLSFTASKIPGNKVLLHWVTENEINNSHFEIQRSQNGTRYEMISRVNGSASLSSRKEYSYTDVLPNKGDNFYRLKQVDLDSRFEFSPVRKVSIDTVNSSLNIYPNPVTDELFIDFSGAAGKLAISIFDTKGRQLLSQVRDNSLVLKLPVQFLPAGAYWLQVSDGMMTESRLFIKQ